MVPNRPIARGISRTACALPASRRAAWALAALLAAGLWAAASVSAQGSAKPPAELAAPAPPPATAPRPAPSAWAFGERVVVRGCLRFRVDGYRDRQSDVDNHDWVRLRVENGCPKPIRNLLIELLLVDSQGTRYGAPLWVLGKGESLAPGAFREDDQAIPDPDSRVARRWSLRVLRADGLPRPAPPAEKKG